jgi:hypothetical protein
MAYKIEHRIGIAAPVEVVYDIVSALEDWPSWSPIHRKVVGKLGFGAPLHLEEHYEGLGVWEVTGAISDWSPLSHIHVDVPKPFYAGSLMRFFEFDTLSETGCSFAVGALFSGFLSEREGRRFASKIKPGLATMCEALKARAETDFTTDPDRLPRYARPVETPARKPLVKTKEPAVKPVKMFK